MHFPGLIKMRRKRSSLNRDRAKMFGHFISQTNMRRKCYDFFKSWLHLLIRREHTGTHPLSNLQHMRVSTACTNTWESWEVDSRWKVKSAAATIGWVMQYHALAHVRKRVRRFGCISPKIRHTIQTSHSRQFGGDKRASTKEARSK